MKGRFPRKRKLKKISRVSLSAIAKNLCIFEHYFFAAFLNDQGFDKNCYYPRALILLGAQKESLCTNIYITAGEAAWMRTFFRSSTTSSTAWIASWLQVFAYQLKHDFALSIGSLCPIFKDFSKIHFRKGSLYLPLSCFLLRTTMIHL